MHKKGNPSSIRKIEAELCNNRMTNNNKKKSYDHYAPSSWILETLCFPCRINQNFPRSLWTNFSDSNTDIETLKTASKRRPSNWLMMIHSLIDNKLWPTCITATMIVAPLMQPVVYHLHPAHQYTHLSYNVSFPPSLSPPFSH